MDNETYNRALYRNLRFLFNRTDLCLTTLHNEGARISYLPSNITVESTKHATLLENRIQCLIDIIVRLGIDKTGRASTGERQPN